MLRLSTYFCYECGVASKPYHHGDLRAALIQAALGLIAEVGPQAFTLREVARRADVSHNAPYRHFRDKDELLAVLAAEGFERLTTSMNETAAAGVDALDRFRLCGLGYVEFALEWPQHFQVMFDSPDCFAKYPEHEAVGKLAFRTLLGFIVECQAAHSLPPGDPQPISLLAWSIVHGVAKLAGTGHLPFNREHTLAFTNYAVRCMIHSVHGHA
jgi:AcrR family transcriptional regulator